VVGKVFDFVVANGAAEVLTFFLVEHAKILIVVAGATSSR